MIIRDTKEGSQIRLPITADGQIVFDQGRLRDKSYVVATVIRHIPESYMTIIGWEPGAKLQSFCDIELANEALVGAELRKQFPKLVFG